MTRNYGVAFLFLAMSFGCRKKEVAPPVVVEPPPHNMIHLDQPVVVNSGDDQPAGTARGQTGATTGTATAAAADETSQRKKTAEHAAEQQAPAPKAAQEGGGKGSAMATETAKPAQAEPTDKTRPARTRKSQHERAAGTAVAAALKPVPAAPDTEAATAHATLNFKNDAGGDFKLVDARFLMDGADLPSAITSAERGKTYKVFSGDIGVGQHMVTARLTYQGATHGVFTYMNGYSFKVSSEEVVNLRRGGDTTFTIICNEKKGLNQPIDKRLVVSLEEHGAAGGGN